MPEVLLDVADDIVMSASRERFKHRNVDGYIDHVKGLMGEKLVAGLRRFRQKYSPGSSARGFDYGGAYLFLPVYLQANRDSIGIDWSKFDPELTLQDLKDHAVSGSSGIVYDQEWSRSKLEAFGIAMNAYMLVGTTEMENSGSAFDYTGFVSGYLYMAHAAVSQLELARVRKMLRE